MMKKQKRNNEDNRGIAIYARKSRITNKGDSIGVQFKQCAEYAKRELHLDDNYSFMEYEDKGLSGYYSDRPDFQRMLHDIEMGKIRAVVCYKLDRIGRKTSDLLRLLDFLEKHKVDLLICSNNINTASGVSKIFIQIFAVVAEFERDTLTERITDNMMELANALLAGLVYCPHCGKRLRVISESNRRTNGKPRFKYVCPGYRLGECTFRAVDGVLLGEFVVKQLSNLSDEDSEYFVKLLNQKASDILKSSQNEQKLIELKKKKA